MAILNEMFLKDSHLWHFWPFAQKKSEQKLVLINNMRDKKSPRMRNLCKKK